MKMRPVVPTRSTDVYDEANGEGACPKVPHYIHTVYWAFSKTGTMHSICRLYEIDRPGFLMSTDRSLRGTN